MRLQDKTFDFNRYPQLSDEGCENLQRLCESIAGRYDMRFNRIKKYSYNEEELLRMPAPEEQVETIAAAREWIADYLHVLLSAYPESQREAGVDPVLITDIQDEERCPDIQSMWDCVTLASLTKEQRTAEYETLLIDIQMSNLRIKKAADA